jgi:hypothetical protein
MDKNRKPLLFLTLLLVSSLLHFIPIEDAFFFGKAKTERTNSPKMRAFVTGGGWIDSVEGAYNLDPSLTGRARFGFVSKYKDGAREPSGNIEFSFHMADLNFHSTGFEWLIIVGSMAKFKGTGAINGEEGYRFMVTVVDSYNSDGEMADIFRIEIWDMVSDMVIYDNKLMEGDDLQEGTVVCGGNITVHNKG